MKDEKLELLDQKIYQERFKEILNFQDKSEFIWNDKKYRISYWIGSSNMELCKNFKLENFNVLHLILKIIFSPSIWKNENNFDFYKTYCLFQRKEKEVEEELLNLKIIGKNFIKTHRCLGALQKLILSIQKCFTFTDSEFIINDSTDMFLGLLKSRNLLKNYEK